MIFMIFGSFQESDLQDGPPMAPEPIVVSEIITHSANGP